MKLTILVGIAALAVGIFFSDARAQDSPDLAQGFNSYGAYHGGDLDSVSISNGNLILHIPYLSYPERGSAKNDRFLIYNNENWQSEMFGTSTQRHLQWVLEVKGGVGVQLVSTNSYRYRVESWKADGSTFVYHYSTVTSPDGSKHYLGSLQASLSIVPGPGVSIDGSVLRTGPAAVNSSIPMIIDRAGTRIGGAINGIEDRNGNQMTGTDTMGRATPSNSPTDISGCPSGSTSATVLNELTIGGGTVPYKFCYKTYSLSNTSDPTFIQPSGIISKDLLIALLLPNNTEWLFDYDPAVGDLIKLTLPTGGSISYIWTETSAACKSYPGQKGRAVTTRTINANDGTPTRTWNYTATSSGRIVSDPDGNDTVHIFDPCVGIDTRVQYFSGAYTSGNWVKTVNTEIQILPNPHADLIGDSTQTGLPTKVTTIWPNGLVSRTETIYDNALTFYAKPFQTGSVQSYQSSYGKAVRTNEYDYAQNAPGVIDPALVHPGSLIRSKIYQYRGLNDINYLNNNLIDLEASVQVLDGNGNQVALTAYDYDQYTLQGSGITTQRNATPAAGIYRGNKTSAKRWESTSITATINCFVTLSNGNLTSYITYFDTGMPYQATDSCGQSAEIVPGLVERGGSRRTARYATWTC